MRGQGRISVLGLSMVILATAPTVSAAPTIAGCPVFPDDNIWNARVDTLPVDPRSAEYVTSIGPDTSLFTDFGAGTFDGGPIGIPFTTVPGTQPRVPVTFDVPEESDPGPYPIPPDAPIEGGPASTGDRHVLVVERDSCVLYELFSAFPQPDGSWQAFSGAVFDLRLNRLRTAGFTSADAAGLAILPGLVRFDEVAAGEVRHAVRFTARRTQQAFVWPARHFASSITDPSVPPMGQRFRLKASVDISGFSPAARVILQGLKTYGMMLADNGSDWFISGVPDERWDNDELRTLRGILGSDFEAVDVSSLLIDPDSGQTRGPAPPAVPLVAAVLPSSRSVGVGVPATAFATIINAGLTAAVGCAPALTTALTGTFSFQTTDPATNQVTGTPDTPIDIAPGGRQSFVFAVTPTGPIAPTELVLSFDCANTPPALTVPGLNTLLLSASASPVPDIVALAVTPTNDGVLTFGGAIGAAAFAVATVNLGAGGVITVTADTGAAVLPLTLGVCETDPGSGACISPVTGSLSTTVNANATPTFAIFGSSGGTIPFNPAVNRVFVRFRDAGGAIRGSTSVAVRTTQ